jgi:hypothetical protein
LNDVEALDDVRVGNQPLDGFAEGISGADEQSRPPGGEVERVAGVENDLAFEVVESGKL